MSRLIHSAKFWTAIVDVVTSIILYFVTKYACPSAVADVKFLIGALQGVFALIIVGIFVEDAAAKKAGTFQHD